jgi:hypothetical protein
MKVKNLTSMVAGAKVTSRRPPKPEVVIIVRGTFRIIPNDKVKILEGIPLLVQGPLKADVFEEEDEARAGEVLYPSDFAEYKPRADVMARGTCYVPDGVPLAECGVRFGVGG